MTTEHDPPLRVHIASAEPGTMPAAPARRQHTKYTTVKIPQANADGAFPVLPYDEHRIEAVIIAHNPASTADAATSSGWIGTSKAGVQAQDPTCSSYVHASGQGPLTVRGCEAVFAASDPASTTDLWLSVADSTGAGPA